MKKSSNHSFEVLLPKVILANFGYPLIYLLPKTFKLFGFPIFWPYGGHSRIVLCTLNWYLQFYCIFCKWIVKITNFYRKTPNTIT